MPSLPTRITIDGAKSIGQTVTDLNNNFIALDIAAGGAEGYGYVRPAILDTDYVLDQASGSATLGTWILPNSLPADIAAVFFNPEQLTIYGSQLLTNSKDYTDEHWRIAMEVGVDGYTPNASAGAAATALGHGVVSLSNEATIDDVYGGSANITDATPIAVHPRSLGRAFQLWKAKTTEDAGTPTDTDFGTVVMVDDIGVFADALVVSGLALAPTPKCIIDFLGSGANIDIDIAGTINVDGQATMTSLTLNNLEILANGTVTFGTNVDVTFANTTFVDLTISDTLTASRINATQLYLNINGVGVNAGDTINQLNNKNGFAKISLINGASLAIAYATEDSKIVYFETDDNIEITGGTPTVEGNINRVDNKIKFGMKQTAKGCGMKTVAVATQYVATNVISTVNQYYVRAEYVDSTYVQEFMNLKVYSNGLLLTPGIDYFEDVENQVNNMASAIIANTTIPAGRLTFLFD